MSESAVSAKAAAPATGAFQRKLGLFDATMLVAGAMIGSGIFIVSADIARDVGASGWLILVWVLSGVMTIIGALSFAELAAMLPHAGGQYVFLREAYSPLWAFLYGWTTFLVIQTGFIAAVAVAFAKYLGVLMPALGTDAILWQYPAHISLALPVPWLEESLTLFKLDVFTISAGQLVAVGVVVLLTAWNSLGVEQGRWVQNVFTVAKTLALVLLIVVGLTAAASLATVMRNVDDLWLGMTDTKTFQETWSLVGGNVWLAGLLVFCGAMVGALFSSDAWNQVTFVAGEVKNPRRTLPLGLMLGTGLVVVLYVLANFAYLAALPLHGNSEGQTAYERGINHAKDDRVATAVLEEVSPRLGVPLMAIAIMISTFGCDNGLVLMGPRLYYAMARDGLFFRSVGRLNTAGVPAAGLILQAAWSVLLIFSGSYSQLLDYIIFAALLFYIVTVLAVFVLRWRQPDLERPYRAFGYPVVPALYIVLCAIIALSLLVVKPDYTWPGLLIVLAGVPVYFVWRWLARPDKNAIPDTHG
jgi:APA family basic amino acid/polyamine antiporter